MHTNVLKKATSRDLIPAYFFVSKREYLTFLQKEVESLCHSVSDFIKSLLTICSYFDVTIHVGRTGHLKAIPTSCIIELVRR